MQPYEKLLKQYEEDAERVEKRIAEISAAMKKNVSEPSEYARLRRRRESLKEGLADIRAGMGNIIRYLQTKD